MTERCKRNPCCGDPAFCTELPNSPYPTGSKMDTLREVVLKRRERAAREASFPKCWCGNTAGVGQEFCGRHRPEDLSRFDSIAATLAGLGIDPAELRDYLAALP